MVEDMNKDNYLLDLIGRSTENAISKIVHDHKHYRITKEDDTEYIGTCDFDISRINLEIKNGCITKATRG